MKRLWGSLIILALLVIVFSFWYKEGLLPVEKDDNTAKIFVIKQGESINSIVNNLKNADLIRDKLVFYLLIKKLGIEKSIQAGDFRLTRSMSAVEIAKELTHGTLDVWVTIIEGLRKEEIANIFAKSHNIPETLFIEKAVEGYLFPDTYLIPRDAGVEQILKILSDNFEKKVSKDIVESAKNKGFSKDELLTLASIIERETQSYEDKKIVAGVLLNRLRLGMPLQVDATIQYALGYDEKERSWWKKQLSNKDLRIDSAYNTYINTGLPPGPICNPGLDSILAVIDAVDTNYLYYISDKTGKMHYATTLEEHNRNISKYLQ